MYQTSLVLGGLSRLSILHTYMYKHQMSTRMEFKSSQIDSRPHIHPVSESLIHCANEFDSGPSGLGGSSSPLGTYQPDKMLSQPPMPGTPKSGPFASSNHVPGSS